MYSSFCSVALAFLCVFFFFFNDTATTEIYTLSLHDALPIWPAREPGRSQGHAGEIPRRPRGTDVRAEDRPRARQRSEEHTSELQSRLHLVCRLLLEKKNKRDRSFPGALLFRRSLHPYPLPRG